MFLFKASWLYQSGQLMTKLKQAQLQAQYLKQKKITKEKDGGESKSFYKKELNDDNVDLIQKLRHKGKKSKSVSYGTSSTKIINSNNFHRDFFSSNKKKTRKIAINQTQKPTDQLIENLSKGFHRFNSIMREEKE